jgi:predicted enzyme related to lactoylglutathione lyase
LGLALEPWGGAILRWPDDKADDGGLTVWNAAAKDTKWFAPSESNFMINYRVDDLDGMLEQLKEAGVQVVGGPDSAENGKFAWIMDPDGNKVELWEPMAWDEKNKG